MHLSISTSRFGVPMDETLSPAMELGCESRDQGVQPSEEPSSGPLKPVIRR
ncbi:hypothetical protein LguiA_003598 [Lonicera macranthoides]